MKKPRLSGSLDYMSGGSGGDRRKSASGSLTFSGGLGSITPGVSYSKDSSRQRYSDGVVVDEFGRRIGISINGELFLDEGGQNKLRAGASKDTMTGGYSATSGEELLGEDAYKQALERYFLGLDLGPLSLDVNKAGDDVSGRAAYRAGENMEFSVEDSNRGDPTFGFQFAKKFNDGGPVAAEENPFSILNLDPDAFVAALDELGLQGEERKFLTDQYFAQSRALPMTSRPEGKTVRNILPIATPEGMTGAEALMSGDFDFTAPEILRGLYEGPAEAINVASAIGKGVPVTEDQVQQAGRVVPEMITGIGPATFAARSLARGVEMPDPSVVSMSGVGPRGMGDNGGPAMQPQRYINPQTGMYSPSYEAAKVLPQEVGTAQQMRSMLLKAGAKEEELVYSGFDDWLKGKEKVTKQEIEDVLGSAAAGYAAPGSTMYDPVLRRTVDARPGNMPYVRESNTADAGITGVQGTSLGDLQDSIYERILEDYNAQRRETLIGGLQERGYSFPQITDEASFRDFAARTRQQFNAQGTGYRGPRVPSSVINSISRIEARLDRDDDEFSSPEVQRMLRNGILNNTDGMIRPDGSMTHIYDAIADEFPDENPALELSRGNMPEEVRDRASRAYDMSPEEAANYLGVDIEDVLSTFSPGSSQYGAYVMPGMKNYSENLYKFDDEGRGVLSGLEALGVSRFRQPHFFGERSPTMFFTLTGELNTADGPAYHIAQLQSDIGQSYRKDPERFFVPGSTSEKLDFQKPEKKLLENYVGMGKRYEELQSEISDREMELYDRFLDEETGSLRKSDPSYADYARALQNLRRDREDLRDELRALETKNMSLFLRLEDHYGKPLTYTATNRNNLDFTVSPFEQALSGKAPAPNYAPGKRIAALPFATSTNRWVDTALKSELIKAAKSNAEWFTLPRGEDVQRYTGGKLEGQTKFYEGVVPNRLKNLAKDFLPESVEFRNLKAMGYGPKAPEYEVFGLRLTPEIKKAILEGGFPSFAKGGPVQGSSLDVDVFALR